MGKHGYVGTSREGTEGRQEQTALADEIARVCADGDFMQTLQRLTERDKEILDRLAE